MAKQVEEINFAHKHAILAETVAKERLHGKLYTDFSINPYASMYCVTGKPNALPLVDQEQEDALMRQVIGRSQKKPTEKYQSPQTEAQEIGWMSKPMLELNRSDLRFYRPRAKTDVTASKVAEWRLKEQTQNMN